MLICTHTHTFAQIQRKLTQSRMEAKQDREKQWPKDKPTDRQTDRQIRRYADSERARKRKIPSALLEKPTTSATHWMVMMLVCCVGQNRIVLILWLILTIWKAARGEKKGAKRTTANDNGYIRVRIHACTRRQSVALSCMKQHHDSFSHFHNLNGWHFASVFFFRFWFLTRRFYLPIHGITVNECWVDCTNAMRMTTANIISKIEYYIRFNLIRFVSV